MNAIAKPYQAILRCDSVFLNAAEHTAGDSGDDFTTLSAFVSAPTLFSYVWWTLQTAIKKQVKHLYFLARDGYVMYQIAQRICKACHLSVSCSYLYCSRYSLRMAAYRFHGDAAYDMLFLRCSSMTAYHVLKRAALTRSERQAVYAEIGYDMEQERELMPLATFDLFCNQLRQSEKFTSFVNQHSDAAYDITMAYFAQEGMFRYSHIGIVDTGWTGSMQYTLAHLLRSGRKNAAPQISGFYFGLYNQPKSDANSRFYTWYFSTQTPIMRSAKFNNNLFECFCAAPHGMTLGYRRGEMDIQPIFSKDESGELNANLVEKQLNAILSFSDVASKNISFSCFDENRLLTITAHLLQRVMYAPSGAEAVALGRFYFCDDISEEYHNQLAETASPERLRACLLHRRIWSRILHTKPDTTENAEFFWSYGSLALSKVHLPSRYRRHILCWELVRLWRKRRTK